MGGQGPIPTGHLGAFPRRLCPCPIAGAPSSRCSLLPSGPPCPPPHLPTVSPSSLALLKGLARWVPGSLQARGLRVGGEASRARPGQAVSRENAAANSTVFNLAAESGLLVPASSPAAGSPPPPVTLLWRQSPRQLSHTGPSEMVRISVSLQKRKSDSAGDLLTPRQFLIIQRTDFSLIK